MERWVPLGIFLLLLSIMVTSILVVPAYAARLSMGEALPSANKDDYYLLALTNKDREQTGLKPLRLNEKLLVSASNKCSDLVTRNYWGHVAPDGKGLEAFIDAAGIKKYSKAAENLAIGQRSLDEANDDWMNSPPHRESILDADYTDVGFARCVYHSEASGLEPMTIYVEHFLAQ